MSERVAGGAANRMIARWVSHVLGNKLARLKTAGEFGVAQPSAIANTMLAWWVYKDVYTVKQACTSAGQANPTFIMSTFFVVNRFLCCQASLHKRGIGAAQTECSHDGLQRVICWRASLHGSTKTRGLQTQGSHDVFEKTQRLSSKLARFKKAGALGGGSPPLFANTMLAWWVSKRLLCFPCPPMCRVSKNSHALMQACRAQKSGVLGEAQPFPAPNTKLTCFEASLHGLKKRGSWRGQSPPPFANRMFAWWVFKTIKQACTAQRSAKLGSAALSSCASTMLAWCVSGWGVVGVGSAARQLHTECSHGGCQRDCFEASLHGSKRGEGPRPMLASWVSKDSYTLSQACTACPPNSVVL